MPGAQTVRIAIPLLTIPALHAAVITGNVIYAPAVIAVAAAAHLVTAVRTGGSRGQKTGLAAGVAVLLGLQALVLFGDARFARAIALPPVLIHGWLAWYFGRTLVPGREPLIHRFSRFSRGHVPAELKGYTRRLTVAWTAMFVIMMILSAVIGASATPATWSWVVNIAMPLVAAAAFLADHAYRAVAYRHLGHNSPLRTLRTLARLETWTAP